MVMQYCSAKTKYSNALLEKRVVNTFLCLHGREVVNKIEKNSKIIYLTIWAPQQDIHR